MHLCRVLNCLPSLGCSPPAFVPTDARLGSRSLLLPRHGPRRKEPPLTDGRFDALATCHLQGLRVREGRVVGMKSTLEAIDSQESLVMSRSKLGKVFRSEGPRHTPMRQGPNRHGLQQSDVQAKRGGRPIIQLRTEPFEAYPYETDL